MAKGKLSSGFVNDIIQWDVLSWSCALRFWEEALDSVRSETPVTALELGSREGGLSLWLAAQGVDVVCSDLKDAEKTARPLHEKYPDMAGSITYQNIDATSIPHEEKFHIVIFKSVLGGVGVLGRDAQRKAIVEIYKALKPGGILLFAENLTASPLHRKLRRRFVEWGNRWRYVELSEMHDLLSGFSDCRMRTTGFAATFGRSEAQRRFLARLDKLIFNHIVPSHWHYISYGYAVK